MSIDNVLQILNGKAQFFGRTGWMIEMNGEVNWKGHISRILIKARQEKRNILIKYVIVKNIKSTKEGSVMKSTEFKTWMDSIERMSRNQRDKLRKRLEGKENTDEVIALIERNQDDKPACPYLL